MKKNYIPYFNGYVDFVEYHKDGKPIYMVDGHIVASFDLMCGCESRYNFESMEVKREVERGIMQNISMFDVEESKMFYYPNTNMFSNSNEERGIHGLILSFKRKYA